MSQIPSPDTLRVKTAPMSRLRVVLRPSRYLAAALAGAHILAAAGLTASRLPNAVLAVALPILAASFAFTLRRHAWLASPRSLVLLDLSDTLEMETEERSGRRLVGTVLGTTFVAPWLVVINFKREGVRLPGTVVVLPDSTDSDSHRALRVWLRWHRPAVRER